MLFNEIFEMPVILRSKGAKKPKGVIRGNMTY